MGAPLVRVPPAASNLYSLYKNCLIIRARNNWLEFAAYKKPCQNSVGGLNVFLVKESIFAAGFASLSGQHRPPPPAETKFSTFKSWSPFRII